MRKTYVIEIQDSILLAVSLELTPSPFVKATLGAESLALLSAHKALELEPWQGTDPVILIEQVGRVLDWKQMRGIELPVAVCFTSLLSGRLIRANFRDGEDSIPLGYATAFGEAHPLGWKWSWGQTRRSSLTTFLEDVESP